jgi:hypothetical protein
MALIIGVGSALLNKSHIRAWTQTINFGTNFRTRRDTSNDHNFHTATFSLFVSKDILADIDLI